MPVTELSGSWRSVSARARPGGSGRDASLPALLSGLLVAYAVEFERSSGLALILSANALRVLDEAGVPVRRLSALTGIADMGVENMLSALSRRGYVLVGRDPAGGRARLARVSADGLRAQAAYDAGVPEVERAWEKRGGRKTVRDVRTALEVLVGSGSAPDSPVLAGLTPYADGWRADLSPPHTLPHFPFVSHRGGFPDGS
jgi:DNA-binding MarR family transcriptional regulator